jgi:hypothetical protein
LVKKTVIVTDMAPKLSVVKAKASPLARLWNGIKGGIFRPGTELPVMQFLPDYRTLSHKEAWWLLSPEIIQAFLGVLGFGESHVSFHSQEFQGRRQDLFTVVADRTAGEVCVQEDR